MNINTGNELFFFISIAHFRFCYLRHWGKAFLSKKGHTSILVGEWRERMWMQVLRAPRDRPSRSP